MRGTQRVRGPMRMTCGKVRESTKETSPVLVSTTSSQERHETKRLLFSSRNCAIQVLSSTLTLNNTYFLRLIPLPFSLHSLIIFFPLLITLCLILFLSYIILILLPSVFCFSPFFCSILRVFIRENLETEDSDQDRKRIHFEALNCMLSQAATSKIKL